MYETLVLLQIFGVALTVCAMMSLFRGEATYAQKLMLFFIVAALVDNAAYLLEMGARDATAAMLALKMEYLGSVFVVLFYMMFMSHYCGYRAETVTNWILAFIDLLMLILVWTAEYHHLYYKKIEFTDSGLYPHLVLEYGIGFWMCMLLSIAVPYIGSVVILVRRIREEQRKRKRKLLRVVLLESAFPILILILYMARLFPAGYDPTSISLSLTMSTMVIFIWNKRDFDVVRAAANTTLDSMQELVIVIDERRRIIRYNPSALQVFPQLKKQRGLTEVGGFPMYLLDGGDTNSFEMDGRYYESHISEIRDFEKEICGYSILLMDMTKIHEDVQQITRMRELAEVANRTKSDFLANMSHEIRTPMNAIMGMSEFVMEESYGRKVYEYAYNIKVASLHLLSIINNILDLSKVESGKLELNETEYPIEQLVDEAEALMKVSAMQSGLQLKTELDRRLPYLLYGDPERIRQIIINVVNNGIKFTKVGHVCLKVSGEYIEETVICLRLIIEDTGIGIKQEDMDRIFEMFQQVDMEKNRAIEGSGLGLSITRQLVELMHGEMKVESEYGKGTKFIIEIPQQVKDKRTVEQMPVSKERTKEKAKDTFCCPDYQVLIVDDNKMNRIVTGKMLEKYEFRIETAGSGQEAIEKIQEQHYEMILMDHMMPEMDGVEATRIMRQEYPECVKDTVFIALTANALQGAKEMYLRNGFQDFLAKPIERQQLQALLNRWIPENRKQSAQADTI